jgi:hypothetical protein
MLNHGLQVRAPEPSEATAGEERMPFPPHSAAVAGMQPWAKAQSCLPGSVDGNVMVF